MTLAAMRKEEEKEKEEEEGRPKRSDDAFASYF
jgi:hypothetical protein